ncbi:MAG: DUF7009 family protein [Bryobacteraceae bacterium]
MKLRIHSGSIRLRLKQSEVKALIDGSEIVEICPTLPVPLTYALRSDPEIDRLVAHSDANRLTVKIPAAWLVDWETDSRVGFESTEGAIHLLIEKDWKCTNPSTPQDNEDCFDNPVAC